MEDEILDYNWVMSHEVPLKEKEGTLFQEYFNEESLILAAAMLQDNKIDYHLKVDNPESKTFGNLVHELHINENELERANALLELLLNEDQNYPVKRYRNHSLSSLELILEENENVYTDTLVKMELNRRGVQLVKPEVEAKYLVPLIIYISILLIIFLIVQFINEIISL